MVHATPDAWHQKLPYVVLGYNAGVQKSTGLSPYQLLHAVPPTIPSSIRERFGAELDLDDPVLAAQSVYQRALALQQDMITAGNNLAIAQHRDQLRYAQTRAGGYTSRREQMKPGAYVYLNVNEPTALELRAHPEVLRVVAVKDSGVLTLKGQCGSTIDMHVSACSPCHVPVADEHIYPTLARPSTEMACEVCLMATDGAIMLLCDGCGSGWHMYCLSPPLTAVPDGVWVCPSCEAAGVDKASVELRAAAAPAQPVTYTMRPGDHMELDGRQIYQLWRHGEAGGQSVLKWHVGTATYLGHRGRWAWFRVDYDDGDSVNMTLDKLRAVIESMPPTPPPGVAVEVAPPPTAPVPAEAPVAPVVEAQPLGIGPAAPVAAGGGKQQRRAGRKSVTWAAEVHEPAPTLRRSSRRAARERLASTRTKESLQDVRVASVYASLI
jgi:hypothetical protein